MHSQRFCGLLSAGMGAKPDGQNEYEKAFEGWLCERGMRFARVDQTHRCLFEGQPLKTFDYVLYPKQSGCVLVELKGRLFRGCSLARRTGLQTWVLAEDVAALAHWRTQFDRQMPPTRALFVFAYRIEQIAADCDGLDVYEADGQRFIFLAIRQGDYQSCMRPRSGRWKTVSCPAKDFRVLSFPLEQIWLGEQNTNEFHDTYIG